MKLSREEIEGIKQNFNQKSYYAMGNLTGKAVLDMALAAHDMAEALDWYANQNHYDNPDDGSVASQALEKWRAL